MRYLATIANEIEEAEKLIHDFGIQNHQSLGELVRKILFLQKEILGEQVKTNQQKWSEYEAAEQDYKDYSKEYDANQKKKYQSLSLAEQKLLKKLHRKAIFACHPDKVPQELKAKAAEIFLQLQKAYEENDLEKVKKIANQLEQGIAFISNIEQLEKNHSSSIEQNAIKDKMIALQEHLDERKKILLEELKTIHEHETYQLIISIKDWKIYFKTAKEELQKELETLTKTIEING